MNHLDYAARSYPLLENFVLTAELLRNDYEVIEKTITRYCAQTETKVK